MSQRDGHVDGSSERSESLAPLGDLRHPRLSPDIERMLREAEARLGRELPQASPGELSPEEEVDLVLPAEVLHRLDEPLELDDERELAASLLPSAPSRTPEPPRVAYEEVQTTSGGHHHASGSVSSGGVSSGSAGGSASGSGSAGGSVSSSSLSGSGAYASGSSVSSSGSSSHLTSAGGSSHAVSSSNLATSSGSAAANSEPRSTYRRAQEAASSPPKTIEPPPFAERVLIQDDEALRTLARAVTQRMTGAIRYEDDAGLRRVVLSEGDLITAVSNVASESLIGFLTSVGDLAPEVGQRLEGRIPAFGRLAGAALVAHGYITQERLHDVLRAHAAWVLLRIVAMARGTVAFEEEAPAKLRDEIRAFGGSAGAAMVLEAVKRTVEPAQAQARLGGESLRVLRGKHYNMLGECALTDDEQALVESALAGQRPQDTELWPTVLYGLHVLGILETRPWTAPPAPSPSFVAVADEVPSPLKDAELEDAAVRSMIGRRRALIEDSDYFAILGVSRDATSYEIRRAYLDLKRTFDAKHLLRPSLRDLVDDLRLLREVFDEAYEVLHDPTRRDRYRRAIG